MIEIRLNMDSGVEDVLAFKTCCSLQMQDPNLEILVTNTGKDPVDFRSGFDLETEKETRKVESLYPPGVQRIPPGETRAFYCQMDEGVWKSARTLTFFDASGRSYPVTVPRKFPGSGQ